MLKGQRNQMVEYLDSLQHYTVHYKNFEEFPWLTIDTDKLTYLPNHIITIFIFYKILSNIPEARGNLTSFFIQANDFLPIGTCESEFDTESRRRSTHFSDETIDCLQWLSRINMSSIMWKYPYMILEKRSILYWSIELRHKIRISGMSKLDDHSMSFRATRPPQKLCFGGWKSRNLKR